MRLPLRIRAMMVSSSEWISGGTILSTEAPTISAAVHPYRRSAAAFQEVITPSSVLLMIASSEDSTMAASRAWATSASRSRVTSRVKKRMHTKSPLRNMPLDDTTTCLMVPSLQRSRAARLCRVSPFSKRSRMSAMTSASTWNSAMFRPTYSSRA